MYGVVYLIIDGTNDKEYVGQTIHSVEGRFKKHMKKDFYIGKAIRAHGVENFTTAILKECESKEELDRWEKHFIKSRDTMVPNGYNLTNGGEGNIPCEETRAKLSAIRKGVTKSPEHRAKIGAAHKGKIVSDETRAKIGATSRGRHHSYKTRAKMSAKHTGEKNAFFGKHHTNETISKISVKRRHKTPYKNLLHELDARQWSYTHLAVLMELTQSSISNKMTVKTNFTEKDKVKLVEIFGLPAEYLLAT